MSKSFKGITESKLEKEIIEWFIKHYLNTKLSNQLGKFKVVKREYSLVDTRN